jgi:hypothetical protein
MATGDDFYIVFLILGAFAGLGCIICQRHRRQHMLELAKLQQLQRQRQRQQGHANGGRADVPGALAQTGAADPVKRKQVIMDALIPHTMSVFDIKDFSIRLARHELVPLSFSFFREVDLDFPTAAEKVDQLEGTSVSSLEHHDEYTEKGEGSMHQVAAACHCKSTHDHVHTSSKRSFTKRGLISVLPLVVDEENPEEQATGE